MQVQNLESGRPDSLGFSGLFRCPYAAGIVGIVPTNYYSIELEKDVD